MICPDCGVDHHPAGQVDDVVIAEVAEAEAAVDIAEAQAAVDIVEDSNDTAVEIARIEADAQVEQTQILADAAVDIAEADAAADIAAAELVDDEPAGDEMPPPDADVVLDDELEQPDDVVEPAGVEPTAIAVPPQIADDRPAPAAARHEGRGFHGQRHRRGK